MSPVRIPNFKILMCKNWMSKVVCFGLLRSVPILCALHWSCYVWSGLVALVWCYLIISWLVYFYLVLYNLLCSYQVLIRCGLLYSEQVQGGQLLSALVCYVHIISALVLCTMLRSMCVSRLCVGLVLDLCLCLVLCLDLVDFCLVWSSVGHSLS